MTILYLSNFFNHHQSSLADKFYETTEGNYYFIETESLPDEQRNLGYPELVRPYVINYYKNQSEVDRLIMEADVVIHGEAPVELVKKRLKSGKLTFHDNERRYKSIVKYLKWPIYTYNSFFLNQGYMLCASAYASRDFGLSGLRADKCFKWGYYTKVVELDTHKFEMKKDNVSRIIWCGRFINWKHPEIPVKLASILKDKGYSFVIDMYGTGREEQKIRNLVQKLGVEDCVKLHGSRPNDEILSQMREHEIFLFTSDQNEGWGAVLNEAMSSGCAVVASHDIGAVPYLVKDRVNGMIFKSRDLDSLAENVIWLINNNDQCMSIRREAYRTMRNTWNADVACRNFIALAKSLLHGTPSDINDGPCSPAPRMNYNWK